MARASARVPVVLWRDENFRALNMGAQHLYFLLLSQPDLTAAGSIVVRPRRWATLSTDSERATIEWALVALEGAGLLHHDRDAEEAFLPDFFEIEQIPKQPRRVTAAQDAIMDMASKMLRGIAATTLAEACEAAGPRFASGLRLAILERDGYRCARCGWTPGDAVPVNRHGRPVYRGLEIDHVHPRSLGGTDDDTNLQVLCSSCNASKGARI